MLSPRGILQRYRSTSALTLRRTLHELIDDHKRLPYTANATDTWDVLEAADQHPSDDRQILDIYRNASYPKAGGGNANYSREHSWPKSYGFPKDNVRNYPYTDCHHLFLVDRRYNSSRHNKLYRSCDESCTEGRQNATSKAMAGLRITPDRQTGRRPESGKLGLAPRRCCTGVVLSGRAVRGRIARRDCLPRTRPDLDR